MYYARMQLLLLLIWLASGGGTVEAADLWPCPGKCWNNNDIQGNDNIFNALQPMWANPCPNCNSLSPGNCPYGSYYDGAHCVSCLSSGIANSHRIITPTQPNNCSLLNGGGGQMDGGPLTMCAKGYYEDSSLDMSSAAAASAAALGLTPCVPCLDALLECPAGFYPSVCIKTLNSANKMDSCIPCSVPALPAAASSSGYVYGLGAAYDDCAKTSSLFAATALCAWYQTPKWDQGYCLVECVPGYAVVQLPAGQLDLPQCVKCATSCSAGTYPPYCPGGRDSVSSPDCQPCDSSLLPSYAHWTSGCDWTCDEKGYYADQQQCIECSVTQVCAEQKGFYFMGCGNSDPGKCLACLLTGCANGQYLSTAIFLSACQCMPCSAAVLGVTFVVSPCSATSDAVLGDCTPCVAGVSFASTACQPYADTVCTPCTSAQSMPGKLLIQQCTVSSDAVYGACPQGMACNGTAIPFFCDPGKVASVDGLCVCAPATQKIADNAEAFCIPISCSAGTYPDPSTGGCSPCAPNPVLLLDTNSTGGNLAAITSRGGILGFEACGCQAGYFRQISSSSAGGDLLDIKATIACWPCGDLGCISSVQLQEPTCGDGFGYEEPSCICSPGPGVVVQWPPSLYPSDLCAVECAPGFHALMSTSAAAPFPLKPGRFNAFSYLSPIPMDGGGGNPTSSIVVGSKEDGGWCSEPTTSNSVYVGSVILLVLCSDGNVSIVRLDSGEAMFLDLKYYLEVEGLRSNIRATALKQHRAIPGMAWLAFSFWGHCDVYIDELESRECSAVELLSVSLRADCPLGTCVLLVCVCSLNHFLHCMLNHC